MNCPGCSQPMQQQRYEGEVIDTCQHCGGVWLDEGEIARIVSTVKETFTEKEKVQAFESQGETGNDFAAGHLKCPKCASGLNTLQFAYNSGVFVDRCPQKHGIWLDRGELTKIQVIREQTEADYAPLTGKKVPLPPVPKPQGRCCPVDRTALVECQYESQRVDVCSSCGGIWCDDGELKAIIDDREKVFGSQDHADIVASESNTKVAQRKQIVAHLPCVVCNATMERSNFSYNSGIIIDTCRKGHGVWLDHHELERIQIWIERWQTKQPELKQKYGNTLKTVARQSSQQFEKAMAEAREKGQNMSRVGRFLKKAGL